MSGLAGILAGHHAPGVYLWHAAIDPADAAHACEVAGWGFGQLDGWTCPDKAAVLTAFGPALGLPDWYGANLDALEDSLRDLTGPRVLLWDGWSTLAESDRDTFDTVLEILGERAGESAGSAFVVLLRGEGPELDLPTL